MIDEALLLLRDQLNDHLRSAGAHGDSAEDIVVFVDGDKLDPIVFKLGAVSALLVNVEEEATLRAADPFRRTLPDGTNVSIAPDILLNLYVLFAARYKAYEDGLAKLSSIIHYFQSHRVLDHVNTTDLSDRIEKLTVELVTLPFSDQNEIWSALRTTYHPSVLYRVRMLTLDDGQPRTAEKISEILSSVTR